MNQLSDGGRENQLKVPVGITDVMNCIKVCEEDNNCSQGTVALDLMTAQAGINICVYVVLVYIICFVFYFFNIIPCLESVNHTAAAKGTTNKSLFTFNYL